VPHSVWDLKVRVRGSPLKRPVLIEV